MAVKRWSLAIIVLLAAAVAVVWQVRVSRRQAARLSVLSPDHPDADAICLIQSFYTFLVQLAARRGADVDRPRHLQKVTRTK